MGMVKRMPHPLNPYETGNGIHCTLRRVGLKSLSEYGEKVKSRDGNPVVVHTVEFTTPKKLHCQEGEDFPDVTFHYHETFES